jgi:hypothetical protein
MIREVMIDPRKLQKCIEAADNADNGRRRTIQRRLATIAARISAIGDERRRMIQQYATDQMPQDAYVNANIALDEKLAGLKLDNAAIISTLSPDGTATVDERIAQYCERARARFERCVDFDLKRQFVFDYIERVIYQQNKVTIVGSVPSEQIGGTLPFRIEVEIDRTKMCGRRPKEAQPIGHGVTGHSGGTV